MTNEICNSTIEGNLIENPIMYYNKHKDCSVCIFEIATNKLSTTIKRVSVKAEKNVADACYQYLKKGDLVRVKGILMSDNYEMEDGTVVYKLSINGTTIEFLKNNLQENKDEKN